MEADETAVSPFSTGAGGTRFELLVATRYLVDMLLDQVPRGISAGPVRAVRLQQRNTGFIVDDVVVACDSNPERTLALQIKYSIRFSESDAQFAGAFAQCWRQRSLHGVQAAGGRIGLAFSEESNIGDVRRHVPELLDWARTSQTALTFTTKCAKFKKKSAFLEVFRRCATSAQGAPVPSYTTNGRGLSPTVVRASRRYCGAVAVSAYPPFVETASAIAKLREAGIKTNVHFVLSSESVATALEWLEDPPAWLSEINGLIFLNFKPVTRDGNDSLLAKNHPRIAELFHRATSREYAFKIGFDDCSTTGLVTHGSAHSASVDACDSARFSMFVSEKMQAYPCSFMAELCDGHPVTDDNLLQIWRDGELFTRMRESLSPSRCGNCGAGASCLSGCPLFPAINICASRQDKNPVRSAMNRSPATVPLTLFGKSFRRRGSSIAE